MGSTASSGRSTATLPSSGVVHGVSRLSTLALLQPRYAECPSAEVRGLTPLDATRPPLQCVSSALDAWSTVQEVKYPLRARFAVFGSPPMSPDRMCSRAPDATEYESMPPTVRALDLGPSEQGTSWRHIECISPLASNVIAAVDDPVETHLAGAATLSKLEIDRVKDAFAAAVAKKKPKENVDPDAPKKPPTAYMVFSKDERMSGAYEGMAPKEVMSQIAAKWQALSAEEKAEYNAHAEQEREEWGAELTAYHLEHPDVSPPRAHARLSSHTHHSNSRHIRATHTHTHAHGLTYADTVQLPPFPCPSSRPCIARAASTARLDAAHGARPRSRPK